MEDNLKKLRNQKQLKIKRTESTVMDSIAYKLYIIQGVTKKNEFNIKQ